MKRQRGRNRRSNGGQNNNINRHFESNGPDVKIRGSAQQVLEKYLQYAREAQTNGDRVKSEAYFQHAEHYQRTLAVMQANQKPKRDRDDSRNRDQEASAHDDGEASVEDQAETSSEDASSEDPLRVIGDDADTDNSASARNAQDTADADEAKPKRARRKTYKKRSGDDTKASDTGNDKGNDTGNDTGAEADDETDGVMKTLSRGRKPAKSKSDEAPDPSDEPAEEAAAE